MAIQTITNGALEDRTRRYGNFIRAELLYLNGSPMYVSLPEGHGREFTLRYSGPAKGGELYTVDFTRKGPMYQTPVSTFGATHGHAYAKSLATLIEGSNYDGNKIELGRIYEIPDDAQSLSVTKRELPRRKGDKVKKWEITVNTVAA